MFLYRLLKSDCFLINSPFSCRLRIYTSFSTQIKYSLIIIKKLHKLYIFVSYFDILEGLLCSEIWLRNYFCWFGSIPLVLVVGNFLRTLYCSFLGNCYFEKVWPAILVLNRVFLIIVFHLSSFITFFAVYAFNIRFLFQIIMFCVIKYKYTLPSFFFNFVFVLYIA